MDELTHRLWWQLGDVLLAPIPQVEEALAALQTLAEGSGRGDAIIRALSGGRRWFALESLYSEMTWELMGVVA